MTESLSKGQIDRLGNVIRDGHMGDDEWLIFESLRRHWAEVELVLKDKIRGVFPEIDVDISSRLKNFETIGEKLRRSPMRLSQMRDLIGFRIVAPGGRVRQDEIAAKLRFQFQDHNIKTIDRRSNPVHGYRALHLEVEFDGSVFEIQIRTLLQHEWAEAFERLADICGRGIRYGEPPRFGILNSPLHEVVQTSLDLLSRLSKVIDKNETSWLKLNQELISPQGDDVQDVRVLRIWLSMREKFSKFRINFDPDEDHRVILEIIVDLKVLLTQIRESLG